MSTKVSFAVLILVIDVTAPARAGVQIDFADDTGNDTPGFRIEDADGMGISERFQLGSDLPDGADGLDFLRVTGVSTGATDIIDFLVVLPELLVVDIGMADGVGVDLYGLEFAAGGTGPIVDGFKVFHETDAALADPLLVADMSLLDVFFVVGSSGMLESSVGIGLTNVTVVDDGSGFDGSDFASLNDFADDAVLGADFQAGIFADGVDISVEILSGQTIEGQATGSVESIVPEPATWLLGLAATLITVSRRSMPRAASKRCVRQ